MSQSGSKIGVLGVPMDLGQRRRGVDMGPSAVRYAGLTRTLQTLGHDVHDLGNLHVPVAETVAHDPADGNAHNARAIGSVCRDLHQTIRDGLSQHGRMITLGGDHSVALGSISAALDFSAGQGNLGVLWVDAHGDFNTPETTPSGNVHGMVVSALMGRCPPSLTIGDTRLRADQIVYLGVRDLDELERAALRESGICILTMSDLDKHGISGCIHMALEHLHDATQLHVSFDLDSLDPSIAPGVGTAVPGGLSYREAHFLMESLAEDGRVRSLDIVEVNPILDVVNTTGKIAVELTASLFGKRIL